MVRKSLNGIDPDYIKEMFKFVTDISQRQIILSCICLNITDTF